MNITDIDRMLSEKEGPCLSLIIPTARYTRARLLNPEVIEKAFEKATDLLTYSAWPRETVSLIQNNLNALQNQVEYMRLQDGLAIFISPNITRFFLIPFPVTEKVMLGKTFETRDLIYLKQVLRPYFLMALSRKKVRLFKGNGRDLFEIVNPDFPREYVEEYEYEHASIGSSSSQGLKSFERDKSSLRDTRMRAFFRDADSVLDKYMTGAATLFVAGVKEETVDFIQLTKHRKNILGEIPGNYDIDAIHLLAESAWKLINEDIMKSNKTRLKNLTEAIGVQMAVDGIRNVWRSAVEGKGLTLLVEKDYMERAYLKPDHPELLHLSAPAEEYELIQDAVDDVIEIVRAKGGNVVIYENGDLDKFEHIALLLRYSG